MEGFSLNSLNEEQLLPVTDTEGAILVTAGAGSGKTRMLTHRIAHLISDKGVAPYNILAITFTNKAAAEMRERLFQMLPHSHGLWVSTFHAMCVSILRKFIEHIGYSSNFSIYSEIEKERILKASLKNRKVEEKDGLLKNIISAISSAKNEGLSPDGYALMNKTLANIDVITCAYADYEKELKRNNALDFDDLLLLTHQLLKDSGEAREYYQERFKYIHVDEFQDTNTIQYKLLLQLAAKHRNIFAVGDEDQSIYGWRGANIDNIRNFIKDFNAKVYKLEQNYRSTKQILEAANTLISNNCTRIDKNLWTDNEEGLDITYYAAMRESSEADHVIATISALKGKGYRYSDMAILMRVNALSRNFEQRLLQYGYPYKIFGGFKFFERKEIKDILAYARMISNPADVDAILRTINFPKRGIGDAAINQLTNYTLVTGRSMFDTIKNIASNSDLPTSLVSKVLPFSKIINYLDSVKNLPPHQFLTAIVEAIALKEAYSDKNEENENRLLHIDQLIDSAKEYYSQNSSVDINDYLQMVLLYSDTDEIDENKDYVSIATVHSAKGLEFPIVFIVGLEEGLFPLARAAESTAELEEERRLMYVAITRAQKRLYLTRSRCRFMYGTHKDTLPSRFLRESGIQINDVPISGEQGYQREGGYGYQRNEGGYGNQSGFSNNQQGYGYQNGSSGYGNSGYQKSGSSGGYSYGQKSAGYAGNSKKTTKPSPPAYRSEERPIINSEADKFQIGMKVKHKRFGVGKILSIQMVGNNYAEIEFSVGKMTLALNFAPLEIVD